VKRCWRVTLSFATPFLKYAAFDRRVLDFPLIMVHWFVCVGQAGDIRVPHGTLSMSYDARGFLYELPQYCYSSPTNILSAEEASLPKRTGHVGTVEDIPITLRVSASVRCSAVCLRLSGVCHCLGKSSPKPRNKMF
jgi:Ubiquitin-binding domain